MFLRVFCVCLIFSVPLAWAQRPPAPVFVKTLSLEPFIETIEALGTLKANEGVTLSATVTETVSAVHFEDGQKVRAGDVLVEMTSDEEAALLDAAHALVDEAKRQYERVKSLAKTNLTTGSVLDERLQAYQSAKAQLAATQSRLADRRILAPFDGVIGLRNISVGELVKPGDTITTLDDISTMKLDMSVPAVFLGSIKPGTEVIAKTRELNGQPFVGVVTAMDSRIDPVTRSIVVRARIPNEGALLKPGMLMTVTLQKSANQRLLLPEEALVREGYKSFVYRINPGSSPLTVSKQEVQTGPRRPGEVVITAGLEPGDQVVTHGVMRLKDGSPVSVTAEEKGDKPLTKLLQQGAGAAR